MIGLYRYNEKMETTILHFRVYGLGQGLMNLRNLSSKECDLFQQQTTICRNLRRFRD